MLRAVTSKLHCFRSSTLERTEKLEDKPEKNEKSGSSTLERRLHLNKPDKSDASDALIAQLNNRVSFIVTILILPLGNKGFLSQTGRRNVGDYSLFEGK